MKLTRSGRTVTKPAKFATSGVVDKVNVVAGLVDNKANVVTTMMDSNKVNMVATMMDRVDSNVGLVVDKDGSKTRNIVQANQSKSSFLIPVDSLQKQTEKATYIVRLPEKTEVERLKEEFMEVEEDVDDPMAQPEQAEVEEEEKEKEDFSGAGVVFDGSTVENHPEADTINQFSLSHIPIEVIQEGEGGVDEEEFEEEEEEREKTEEEEEEWQEREEGRLSLVRQLGLLQEQQQREEEEISDHVISIEENGHITIEQVSNPISSFSCLLTKTLLRSTRSTLPPLTPCLRSRNGGEGSPPPSSPSSPPATWSTSGWSAATGRRCRRTCSSSRTPPPTSARCWPTRPGTPRRTPSPSPSLTGTATLSGSSCPPSIRDNCLKVC